MYLNNAHGNIKDLHEIKPDSLDHLLGVNSFKQESDEEVSVHEHDHTIESFTAFNTKPEPYKRVFINLHYTM
jgi:hypothetical protein